MGICQGLCESSKALGFEKPDSLQILYDSYADIHTEYHGNDLSSIWYLVSGIQYLVSGI